MLTLDDNHPVTAGVGSKGPGAAVPAGIVADEASMELGVLQRPGTERQARHRDEAGRSGAGAQNVVRKPFHETSVA